MANKRISQLDALTGAGSANDDNLVIFDTSTSTTKRILRSQLGIGIVGDLPYTPSGSISATTIPTAIAELDTEKAPLASPTFTGTVTIPTADINGGTIDGVTIGTSAVATDIRVDNLRLDTNTLSSTDTNGDINLTPNGTGRSVVTNLTATSPRVVTGINDTNGNELVNVTATASAVNEITIANAATGSGPTISTTGDDTNIDLNISLKGTGSINIEDATNIILGTTTGTKIGTSTSQKIGFFNVTPVVQQTELTDELTTITHTAPVTPDYAIQDLTLTTPYGFATKDEGNTVLSVIANLQARVNELETKLVAYGLLPDAD